MFVETATLYPDEPGKRISLYIPRVHGNLVAPTRMAGNDEREDSVSFFENIHANYCPKFEMVKEIMEVLFLRKKIQGYSTLCQCPDQKSLKSAKADSKSSI